MKSKIAECLLALMGSSQFQFEYQFIGSLGLSSDRKQAKRIMENEKMSMHQGALPHVFEKAKNNRLELTKAEGILWESIRLKKLDGFKFRNQHAIGAYIVDFYCHEAKLAIEVDGDYHLEPNQKEYDDERTKLIEASGVKILRFSNHQVINCLDVVLAEMKTWLQHLQLKK